MTEEDLRKGSGGKRKRVAADDGEVGYNTGKGKTAVLSMWVTQLQVRCDILSPVATPYPLSRYHRLKRVFLLYNYK